MHQRNQVKFFKVFNSLPYVVISSTLETDLYSSSIRVQAINHGVVVSSARHQRRASQSGTLEPAIRINDSIQVFVQLKRIASTPQKRRRFNEKSGQTRKSQNSGRPERRRRPSRAVNTTDVWQQIRAAKVPP